MNYRDNQAMQDKLAAEYVLGTLRGRARLRFQAWMREDAALRRRVSEWEERLTPMAAGIAEVRPPKRVWKNIEARISSSALPPASRAASESSPARSGFWNSLAFWRGWGLVATGCAAALVVASAIRQPEIREVVKTVEVPAPVQPSYVAALEDKQGNVAFVALAPLKSDELTVKQVAMEPLRPGQSYELWGLPAKPGERVTSLGVIPQTERGMIKLAAAADRTLADFPQLAISLEPEGGSKTGQPTGPVMYVGSVLQF